MARCLGVPRQSVTYYLKAGVNGAQAAGIIGLIARVSLKERQLDLDSQRARLARGNDLVELLARFEDS